MNRIKLLLTLVLFGGAMVSNAQMGELRGTIYDSGEPLLAASIHVFQGDRFITAAESDDDGHFGIKQLPAGTYTLKIGYVTTVKEFEVNIISEHVTVETFDLTSSMQLDTFVVRGSPKVAVGRRPVAGGPEKQPGLDGEDVAITVSGVNRVRNGGVSINGVRPSGTGVIFDGVLQSGTALPQNGYDVMEVAVEASGIAARYGGFSGGGVRFTTQMPSIDRQLRFDMTSSALTSPYAQNRLHSYLTGPLILKRVKIPGLEEEKKRMVLGYTWANYINYNKDNRPLYGGVSVIDPEALAQIEQNPLRSSELVGGQVMATNFINSSDILNKRSQNNASLYDVSTRFKLAYSPSERTALVFSARGGYSQRQLVSIANMLLNSDRNPLRINANYNLGLDFDQTLKAPYDVNGENTRDTNDHFSHVYYAVKTSYQSNYSKTMDPIHRDNIFDYGDVGRFTTRTAPVYEFRDFGKTVKDENGNEIQVRGFHELTGYRDTSLEFRASGKNPFLSNINEQIFAIDGRNINSMTAFEESAGVRNGYNGQTLYAMFNNPGSIVTNYNKSQFERFTFMAFGEAAFHPFRNHRIQHDLQFGLQFDQYTRSTYSLAAQRLWQLMPLLANNHMSQLDLQNPILSYDAEGRFTDTISYNRLVLTEDQKYFDRNLRQKLMDQGAVDVYGKPITENSIIDVNALDPSVFSVDMFSADELLNNGNAYVAYSGYDHLGNRRRGKTSLNDFLNNPLERPMDSYTPNYAAAWLQDQFVYRDLKMRLGVRIERFDGNQQVLKDPYSFYPVKTAGEVTELSGLPVERPAGISSDAAVYVNNMHNPSKVVGYREGNEWYDAQGIRVADPTILAQSTSNGQIQPYLVDPGNQTISQGSFASYEPVISVLPRVLFTFPINSTAVFFASYDKLAQRPPDGQSYTPLSTYYNIQAFTNSVIQNANMQPRIRTAYEFGFKQLIGRRADLEFKANYATVRNDFNQVRLQHAYPFSYTTYSNVDFSTVKSYTMEYGFQGKQLDLLGSYVLQFADGTGSNVNSASTLLQSGQPNLRSLYPLSFDVRHALKGSAVFHLARMATAREKGIWGKVYRNAFISVNARSLSGTPYTATIAATPEAQSVASRTQVKGQPFGSRMPWQHNVDLKYEKNIPLKMETVEGKIRVKNSLGVYVLVSNLLNTRQVFNVYSYTGSANDDGYLNSPQGQQNAQAQLSAEAFTQLYKIRMDNPYNMAEPRQIKLGVKLNFM